jgi:hypothetical protein
MNDNESNISLYDRRMDSTTTLKVDVGVLKEQVKGITELCSKMDIIIEKLVEQHGKHIEKVYVDMEKRRLETESDIKDIHDRIETVIEKVHDTELKLLDEIKSIRTDIKEEKAVLDKLLQWKWAIIGGILAVGWLFTHVKLDTLSTLAVPLK